MRFTLKPNKTMFREKNEWNGRPIFFLVEHLSIPLAILAVLLRCFGVRTRYISVSRRLGALGVQDFLEHLSVAPIDFETCPEVDESRLAVDYWGMIPQAVAPILEKTEAIQVVGAFFEGVDSIDRILKCALYSHAGRRYPVVASFISWLEFIAVRPRLILAYVPGDIFTKSFWSHAKCRVVNIAPSYGFDQLQRKMIRIIAHYLNVIFMKKRKYEDRKRGKQQSSPPYKVIYFPHQSIFYGKLFKKDYFYSKDDSSPFFPKNILHLEVRPSPSIQKQLEAQINMGLPTYVMPSINIRHAFFSSMSYIKKLWRGRRILLKCGEGNRKLLFYFYTLYVFYQHYRCLLDVVAPRARLALLGYEMLFPVELSLALKSKGIKTVALQERLYATFMGCYRSFVVDEYLVMSRKIAEIYIKKPCVALQNVTPVGLIRTDTLLSYKKIGNNSCMKSIRRKVVALDYHSNSDLYEQRTQPNMTWTSNKSFYKDLIHIAIDFPMLDITIRGKNATWLSIDAFCDIACIINFLPNLTVSEDYKQFDTAYKLCSESDLIIAKHTSLADECIAVGQPVLIHDYAHNAKTIVSKLFDYDGAPFFCHSFKELRQRIEQFLATGSIMNSEEYDVLRNRFFDGLADGRVRQRVQRIINAMADETA
ncbi:MAG: hypothetical protein AB7D07_07925 [Desulfovibrionaceae bacterium]